jgi:N-methylhydantoinase B/oxoprolinase/acetone carboxylase alpha subunit
MKSVLALHTGDVLTLESPGGGGYGDPAKRPDDLVRRDFEEGYVTRWPGSDPTTLNVERHARPAYPTPPSGGV